MKPQAVAESPEAGPPPFEIMLVTANIRNIHAQAVREQAEPEYRAPVAVGLKRLFVNPVPVIDFGPGQLGD
jgi:hypothetical protein